MPISVVIVDDHLLFREGLKAMAAGIADISIIGEAGEGRKALHLVGQHRPDIVLLDITLEGTSGLDLAPRIREISPRTEVLILSMHNNQDYIYRAFKGGCRGYVLKSGTSDELEKAIRTVAKGKTYLCQKVVSNFIDHVVAKTDTSSENLLTKRESQIGDLLLHGRSTVQVAAALFISENTVRVHIAKIKKKLACASRTELFLKLQEMKQN